MSPISTMGLDAAVIDAAQRQSLVAVRSLGRGGHSVGAFDVLPRAPAFRSRWCTVSGVLPDFARSPNCYVAGLRTILDRHEPRVMFVAHDGTIEILRRHRHEFESRVALTLAPEAALRIAVSKSETLALATRLGIGIPRGVLVSERSELSAAISEVGLPAVIKPQQSWVEQEKVRRRLISEVAADHREAHTVAERALAAGIPVVVQEWLPGAREQVWLLYADGRFWARFAQVAHRMFPILGGASVLRESIPPAPELVNPAEALIAGAGLTGFSEVEFRRDAEGVPRLMEINPRFSASLELADRAGVDFPQLVYAWAAGERLTAVSRYRVGVRMRWLSGDLAWLRATLTSQGHPDAAPAGAAVRTFIGDSLRPAGYDYLVRADLRPAAAAATDFIRSSLRAARDRRRSPRGSAANRGEPSA